MTTWQRSLRSGAGSIAVRVGGIALAFALSIVLARLLGPSGYGIYSYAMAAVTLLGALAQLGLPTLIVREVSRYRARERWDLVKGLLVWSVGWIVAMSIVCAAVIGLLIFVASGSMDVTDPVTLSWSLVLIPLIALNLCGGAALRALGRVIRGQIAEQIVRPGAALLLVAAAALTLGPAAVTPATGMALHAAAALFAFAAGAVLLFGGFTRSERVVDASFADAPGWRRSLLPLSVLAGLQLLTSQTDVLMLGFFVEADSVGVYRVAWQAASLVNLILFAIGLSVEPAIARFNQRGEHLVLQRTVTSTGRLGFALSLGLALALVALGRPLLTTVFGPAFAPAYTPLVVLCMGQVGLAYAGWAVLVLNMTGHERTTAVYTAYAAAANVVANAALIPAFGPIGAAFATASTMFLWKVVVAKAARRTTGIHTIVWPGARGTP